MSDDDEQAAAWRHEELVGDVIAALHALGVGSAERYWPAGVFVRHGDVGAVFGMIVERNWYGTAVVCENGVWDDRATDALHDVCDCPETAGLDGARPEHAVAIAVAVHRALLRLVVVRRWEQRRLAAEQQAGERGAMAGVPVVSLRGLATAGLDRGAGVRGEVTPYHRHVWVVNVADSHDGIYVFDDEDDAREWAELVAADASVTEEVVMDRRLAREFLQAERASRAETDEPS